MNIDTFGKSTEDAIEMARDAIGLMGIALEDDGRDLPDASSYDAAMKKAKEDTEFIDYTTGIITLVDVDFAAYRNKMENRAVRKNCTIPYWMNEAAENAGINFSQLLQDAIKSKLNIVAPKRS
jgi:hypothetical protein